MDAFEEELEFFVGIERSHFIDTSEQSAESFAFFTFTGAEFGQYGTQAVTYVAKAFVKFEFFER